MKNADAIPQLINELEASQEFQTLNQYLADIRSKSPEFDIFKAMKIEDNEVIHSNILAVLLDPTARYGSTSKNSNHHSVKCGFVNQFIELLKSIKPCYESAKVLDEVILDQAKTSCINVHRELDYIDLVIEFSSVNLVIGIENKINAHERERQISDYQSKLQKLYPKDSNLALVFLTPAGKRPITANSKSKVPVYCISYAQMLGFCKQLISTKEETDLIYFIKQFSKHLECNIVDKSNIEELCLSLFRKYPEAYGCMVRKYNGCVYEEVESKFKDLIDNLRSENYNESELSTSSNNLKIKSQFKSRKGDLIIYAELNIRSKKWPDGIWIKLYKRKSLSIFSYVTQDKEDLIEKYLKVLPYKVSGWKDYFCFSRSFLNQPERILDDGNKVQDYNDSRILMAIKQRIEEIDNILRG